MTTISTYLNFDGNCEEAFHFYQKAFGGTFNHVAKFKDMPPSDEFPMSEEDLNKIMHISYTIGNTILMGSDVGNEWTHGLKIGNNFSISINTDTVKEADRLFELLTQEGEIKRPLEKMFWGEYFGMFTDKFGINWMISCKNI